MKIITFLTLYLLFGMIAFAQNDISNIALEIQGESVISFTSLPSKDGKQLFYSNSKKKIIREDDPDFSSDKSLLVIKPVIRIFKKSEQHPNNNTLSIIFQTHEIKDGVEIHNSIDCDYNVRLLKIDKWTRQDQLTQKIEGGEIEGIYKTLIIALNPSGSICTFLKSFQKVLLEGLLINDIKLTIVEGKRID